MRLIDADALKPDYIVGSTTTNTSCYRYISKEQIDNTPTVEAVPVRHGEWIKWIKMSVADGYYYACSECGEELPRKWSFDREFDIFPKKRTVDKTHYCPNCGAHMDEVET